jgi:hypothetical protein
MAFARQTFDWGRGCSDPFLSSRFCPWSAQRPPHYLLLEGAVSLFRYAWFVKKTSTGRETASSDPPSRQRNFG